MWVLMYVFSYSVSPAATTDKADWRLLPTVVFQEFTSEERCRMAKTTLESSLKDAGTKLRTSMEDLKRIGGYEVLQEYVADDYQVAKYIAGLGKKTYLSGAVVGTGLHAAHDRPATRPGPPSPVRRAHPRAVQQSAAIRVRRTAGPAVLEGPAVRALRGAPVGTRGRDRRGP